MNAYRSIRDSFRPKNKTVKEILNKIQCRLSVEDHEFCKQVCIDRFQQVQDLLSIYLLSILDNNDACE